MNQVLPGAAPSPMLVAAASIALLLVAAAVVQFIRQAHEISWTTSEGNVTVRRSPGGWTNPIHV